METGFFDALFTENEIINIREIGKTKRNLFFRLADIKTYAPAIDTNIYFGVFSRTSESGKAEACNLTRALFADYDDTTLSDVKKRIQAAGAPTPSIYINSGHGIHCYWLLDTPATPEQAIPIIKGLASATGADPRATDPARVMRVPGTWNNKGKDRLYCSIIEQSKTLYTLGHFDNFKTLYKPCITENIPQKHSENIPIVDEIPELDNSKWPCIKNMAAGVLEGQRNFALGRLTKHLQQRGYTKADTVKVLIQWNKRNSPPEDERRMITDLYSYWHTDYQLLGCDLADIGLQAILNNYCDRSACPHKSKKIGLELDKGIAFNNRLLNEIHRFTGNELVVYGVLAATPRGLTTSQILEKLTARKAKTPCLIDDTFRKCVKTLQGLGFVEVIERGRKSGHENFYRAKSGGSYGLGHTIVSVLAINGVIDGRITPAELKVYIQLLRYAFGKGEAWPSVQTLSRDTRTDRAHVIRCLNELEARDYLYREYTIIKGARCLNYKIRV